MIDFENIPDKFKYYWDEAYPKLEGPEAYREYFLKSANYGKDASISIRGEPLVYQGVSAPNWQDAWVTYITVCRNAAATLEQAMESIFQQTYPKIEYIVIDGDSSDNTREIIERYSSQISFYKSSPDRGIYDAFNQGILSAKGQIIGILNADDLLDKNTVSWMVEAYDDATDFTYAKLYHKKSLGTEIPHCNINKYWYLQGRVEAPFPHPTLLVKKSVYQKIGVFKTIYRSASDVDMIRRLYFNELSGKMIDHFTCVFSLDGISGKRRDLSLKEIEQIVLEIFNKKDLRWFLIKLKYLRIRLKYLHIRGFARFSLVYFLRHHESLKPFRKKVKKFLSLLGIYKVG